MTLSPTTERWTQRAAIIALVLTILALIVAAIVLWYSSPAPWNPKGVEAQAGTATQTGGSNALGTFATTSLNSTSAIFAFSLTPSVNQSEIIQVLCQVT